jgi:hypothetical protein
MTGVCVPDANPVPAPFGATPQVDGLECAQGGLVIIDPAVIRPIISGWRRPRAVGLCRASRPKALADAALLP